MRNRLILIAALTLAGCGKPSDAIAPPRVEGNTPVPELPSTLVVPVSARLADIAAEINRAAPAQLWSIDKREDKCVPAQRVSACAIKRKDGTCRIGIRKLKVTPDLSCRITGQVTRGPITLGGRGRDIVLTMPVRATVSAQDIGGIIKRETATGAASVRANVRLGMTRDWRPTATVRIAYDWTNPPGVTILGKRITFVDKADAKLAGVIAGLERSLPAQLQKIAVRAQLAAAWRQAFLVLDLNRDNPPVWMRITPQRLGFQGYSVDGTNLMLMVAAEARAETFVGDRPEDPRPTPLPLAASGIPAHGLAFNIPVLAQFKELAPVIDKALARRAAKGFNLPKLGAVDVDFGAVDLYATDGGRIAVGVPVTAKLRSGLYRQTRGMVWLTGELWNAPSLQQVSIRNLKLSASTDSKAVNLLIALVTDPETIASIQGALTENFARDYARIVAAATKAIALRREGDFVIATQIVNIRHGRILVTGQGLFLPVEARGTASISYRPGR